VSSNGGRRRESCCRAPGCFPPLSRYGTGYLYCARSQFALFSPPSHTKQHEEKSGLKLRETSCGLVEEQLCLWPCAVFLVEKNPAYLDVVRDIFTAIDTGQLAAMTSPVTLAECLVHPLRLNLPQLQQSFINVVVNGSNTTFVNLDQTVGQQAARLRADYNVRLPDALQLAAAMNNGCDSFLTNDALLKRVPGIQILVVDDLEAN
jgi:predicted nucleic acid-binding protein